MRTLPTWVAVKTPTTLDPSLNIDAGELEAICLAREIHAAAVLMDDRAGQHAAAQCGVPVIGTLGLQVTNGGDRALHHWIEDCGIKPARRLSERQEEAFAELPENTGRDRYELLDEAVDDLLDKYRRKSSAPKR
jgi:hypothetical protein